MDRKVRAIVKAYGDAVLNRRYAQRQSEKIGHRSNAGPPGRRPLPPRESGRPRRRVPDVVMVTVSVDRF